MSAQPVQSRGTLREGAAASWRAVGSLRIPEVLLFFALIFEGPVLGLPVPLNQLVILTLLCLAVIRRPQFVMGRFQLLVPVFVVGLFYLTMVSAFSDISDDAFDWKRRLIRLGITAALLFVIASGRIDLRSGLVGFGLGLVANAIAFYAGWAPDHYGGTLSGFFEDKNVAGLAYGVIGILVVCLVQGAVPRLLLYSGMGYLVLLTDSRTSISAYVAAGLWLLLAPRLPMLGRWLLGGGIWAGVIILAEDFAQIGRYSEREGSDALRARIDAASRIKVGEGSWFGEGLGEAYVHLDDGTWLFHNSYWTALIEGGWPWYLLVLVVTVLVGLRPFAKDLTPAEVVGQAATIGLLICAWRLGEVFFTVQWALVMSYAMLARLRAEGKVFTTRDPAASVGPSGLPRSGRRA